MWSECWLVAFVRVSVCCTSREAPAAGFLMGKLFLVETENEPVLLWNESGSDQAGSHEMPLMTEEALGYHSQIWGRCFWYGESWEILFLYLTGKSRETLLCHTTKVTAILSSVVWGEFSHTVSFQQPVQLLTFGGDGMSITCNKELDLKLLGTVRTKWASVSWLTLAVLLDVIPARRKLI